METNDSGCQSLKQRNCECPRYKWFYSVESDRYQRRREFQDQWKSKVKHYRQNPRLWTLIWKGLFGAKRKILLRSCQLSITQYLNMNNFNLFLSEQFVFLSLETILRQSPVWPFSLASWPWRHITMQPKCRASPKISVVCRWSSDLRRSR